MKRTPVNSSVLHSVGYAQTTSTLEVEFKTGLIYRYRQVPLTKFTALLQAESKGRYFNAHIRDRHTYKILESSETNPQQTQDDAAKL